MAALRQCPRCCSAALRTLGRAGAKPSLEAPHVLAVCLPPVRGLVLKQAGGEEHPGQKPLQDIHAHAVPDHVAEGPLRHLDGAPVHPVWLHALEDEHVLNREAPLQARDVVALAPGPSRSQAGRVAVGPVLEVLAGVQIDDEGLLARSPSTQALHSCTFASRDHNGKPPC